MTYAKPLPFEDRDSAPFWEWIRKGELRLQRCDACGAFRWPPRAVCNRCRSFDATWVATSGTGRVISWTRTHQIFLRAYADDVPYVVVTVALDDQPDIQMPGQLTGGVEPAPDLRVRAVFPAVTDEVTLVHWEPVGG